MCKQACTYEVDAGHGGVNVNQSEYKREEGDNRCQPPDRDAAHAYHHAS